MGLELGELAPVGGHLGLGKHADGEQDAVTAIGRDLLLGQSFWQGPFLRKTGLPPGQGLQLRTTFSKLVVWVPA